MRTPGFKEELERRRRLGVGHVLAGYRQRTVATFLAVHPSSVCRWMKAYRRGGNGALAGRDPSGRPRKLTRRQERQVLGWFRRSPTSFGFPTELWTATRTAQIIYRQWRIKFHPRYLSQWLFPRGGLPPKTSFPGAGTGAAPAALTISPRRRHLGLYFCTYPKDFVNQERSADFLRALLCRLRGPVIVVWDGGPMHHGEAIRAVLRAFPPLSLEKLPPYTPELNPVEYLWNHLKYGVLPNFVPDDVLHLNGVLKQRLRRARQSAPRLRSFFKQSGLPIRLDYG